MWVYVGGLKGPEFGGVFWWQERALSVAVAPPNIASVSWFAVTKANFALLGLCLPLWGCSG